MALFRVKMTGKVFSDCTQQYILFRRARDLAGAGFKAVVLLEAAAAAAALVLAVTQQGSLPMRIFYLLAAVFLAWQAVGKLLGRDTRAYLRRARAQPLSPEDAAKVLEVVFDEDGCLLRAPGTTLPGRDVEEQRLFSYDQVSGLFRSERHLLAASKGAASICLPLEGLEGGSEEELTAFLEARCGRKTQYYALDTDAFRALLR